MESLMHEDDESKVDIAESKPVHDRVYKNPFDEDDLFAEVDLD